MIDGRLTLLEAAGRVRDLPGGLPNWLELVPADEQGRSDGETICRHLIGLVGLLLRDQPDKARLVTSRLAMRLPLA